MTETPAAPPTNRVYNLMTDLAACLCAQIEKDGGPPLCYCGVVPGAAVAADYGDCDGPCGIGWVRLSSGYPASGVGVANETVGNCSSQTGLSIEVGILRCITIEEDGAPSAAALAEATELQARDFLTMQRAIICCDSISSRDYIVGSYTPAGPLGLRVGGSIQIALVV